MIPAVVVGTHTMGLGVIRALGWQGVPVVAVYYDSDDMGYVSKYVRDRIRVPTPEDAEEAFIDALGRIARVYPNSPLFPVSDESLKIISKHKADLSQFYKVACTDWEITQKFIEKSITCSIAERAGTPIPKTMTPVSGEEILELGRQIDFPCFVKPVESHRYYSHFKRKMTQVENLDQLVEAFNQADKLNLSVMVQEMIPGWDHEGVNYNSYFWDGEPQVEFTAKKVRSAPLHVGSPCVLRSQVIPEVLESGRNILRAMQFYGYSCIEFKRDARDGIYKLLDVNGRHNLSTLLAVRCGINFPWLNYLHLVKGIMPVQTPAIQKYYWIDLSRDLAYGPQYLRESKEPIGEYLQPYLKKHVFAVYDLSDIKPFLKRIATRWQKRLDKFLVTDKKRALFEERVHHAK